MVEENSWAGAIVAIEGPKSIVSTQLRLLPTSPQILILPALDSYIAKPASFLDVFDPSSYLRQVNAAMKVRHREAEEFLESSTEANRRMVFLDGGAVSAQALCLKALMHHETAGDRVAAEAVLRRLTRSGLPGLLQGGPEGRHHSEPAVYVKEQEDDDVSSDPSTRAMRAADALDRQTANLQVSNELDLTIRSHSRSSSLPLYGFADTPAGDAAPFLVFGHPSSDEAMPRELQMRSPAYETPRFSVVQYDQFADMPPVFGFDDFPTGRSFVSSTAAGDTGSHTLGQSGSGAGASGGGGGRTSHASNTSFHHTKHGGKTDGHHRRVGSDPISPTSEAFSIRSVGKVEYGRASVFDVRASVLMAGVKAGKGAAASQEPKHIEASITETGEEVAASYNSSNQNNNSHDRARTHAHNKDNATDLQRQKQRQQLSRLQLEETTTRAVPAPTESRSAVVATTSGKMAATASLTQVHSTQVYSIIDRPRTIVVRRTRPVIKLQPVPTEKKRRWQQGRSFLEEDDIDSPDGHPKGTRESEHEPVFPRMEDLVLYLRSDLTPQPLLESALNSIREEFIRKSSECTSPSSKSSGTESDESLKSMAHTDDETEALTSPETSGPKEHIDEHEEQQSTPKTAVPSSDDYDPFAYDNPVFPSSRLAAKSAQPTVTILRPPTPAQTPPPQQSDPVEADSREVPLAEAKLKRQVAVAAAAANTEKEVVRELEGRIYEIDVEPKQPPVATQNQVRSVLSQYYPAESKGFSQFEFPQLLEDDGLWRPIFRSRRTSKLPGADGHGSQQLKQILAVGLQNGVKREYSSRVIAQIEKFGTEPTGSARCTRLDFRYLLANTMQAFTAQPLTSQSSENPFTNSSLLATLMLPHLETYLAMHADIRFLILEYPPEHLGTVIAIQKLAGVDLVKIAQIVDAHSKEPLPFRQVRRGSVSSCSVYSRSSSLPRSRRGDRDSVASIYSSSLDINKTKANFLLTSSASDRDIAAFVAAVWNIPVRERPQTAPESTAAEQGRTSRSSSFHYGQLGLRNDPDDDVPPLPPPVSHEHLLGEDSEEPLMLAGSAAAAVPTPATATTQHKKSVKRKGKPTPLRVSVLSAFPKTTGPQSPLSPTANIMSVLEPPASSASLARSSPPRSTSNLDSLIAARATFFTPRPDRTPSPVEQHKQQQQYEQYQSNEQYQHTTTHNQYRHDDYQEHGANMVRMSAVGGNKLHRNTSSSTVRTSHTSRTSDTASTTSTARTANDSMLSASPPGAAAAALGPHIARMTLPPAFSSSVFGPVSSSTMSMPPPVAGGAGMTNTSFSRYMSDERSVASSSTLNSPVFDNDAASSIMTFDPADDSDYDQEERRLMPMFGKKRPHSKTDSQKALKILGMSV